MEDEQRTAAQNVSALVSFSGISTAASTHFLTHSSFAITDTASLPLATVRPRLACRPTSSCTSTAAVATLSNTERRTRLSHPLRASITNTVALRSVAMPKHHSRGPRHSSTHPRPHAHASIHETPSQSHPTTNKRKRINPLNVYTSHDTERLVAGRGGRDRRYDWDSQERYEYELPDQFVDEEVEEEEAFDDAEEDKYGEIINTIAARQRGGTAVKGQKMGRQRGRKRAKEAEEEEKEEEVEEVDVEASDADGGMDEDDELDEGMTTLSAMLDEPDDDDAEGEDERPSKLNGKQSAKQQKSQPGKPSSELERMMQKVKKQMEATEDDGDVEDEEVEEDEETEENGDERKDEELEDEEDEGDEEKAESDVGEDENDEGEEEGDAPPSAPFSLRRRQPVEHSEEEEDDEEEEEEETDSANQRSHLLSMIEQLGEETEADDRPWRRKDRSVAPGEDTVVEESEYAAIHMPTGAPAATTAASSSKLTLADLMQSLQGTSAPATDASRAPKAGENKRALAQLKKKLSVLSSTSTSASTTTLSEPLPDIRQDEITRRLGYTQVREELERWTPIIERNRDAANLHFPLHAPTVPKATSETMAAAFKPTVKSELERDLDRIMREYGVKERRVGGGGGGGVEGVEEAELKGRELTEEEMDRRRAELSKMKSLLFHHEMKQRRINKIKSKTYRRLRKKLKEKSQLTPEELLLLDPDEAERRRVKAEVERVRERMTLAHTNRSTWMKRQMRVNATVQSGEVKQALEESQRIAQRLRRKVDSVDNNKRQDDSDESEDGSEEDVEDGEDGEEEGEDGGQVQTSRAGQLKAALRLVEEEGSEEEKEEEYVGFDRPPAAARDSNKPKAAAGSGNKSGLLGLKFMQRAMEEKRQQTREAKEQLETELKEELKREVGSSDEDGENEDERKEATGATQQHSEVKGKRKLGGSESRVAAKRDELMGAESGGKSVLLPHSFQSASVGMGRGKRARGGAAIDVDADGKEVDGNDELFEVEAFEEDGQHPAMLAARTVEPSTIEAVVSRVPADGKAADKQRRPNKSIHTNGRYHLQQQPSRLQQTEREDELDVAGDDNPWAQPTDVAGRKALRDEEQKKRRRKRNKSNTTTDTDTANGTAAVSAAVELDVNSVLLSAGQAGAMDEEQQRLVAAAFAVGEDEEKQFADTKAAAISATMPTVEQFTTTLPGWGNWTGEGLQPRPPTVRQQREQRETQRKLLAAQQLALHSRRDSSLPHVIVSEQSDKRASKYLLQRLPFPYTSVDAYEQSLLQPLGKEWNAVEAHQKAVRPAVTMTKGAIIEAVTYHDSEKERREAERRVEDKQLRERQRDGTVADGSNDKPTKTNGKPRKGGERRGLEAGKQKKSKK